MKKLISLTLAAVMLAASLVSCASRESANAPGANIRVTSSDGEDAAVWLAERLGERLPERVVLGTDADGYGVDVSALEDDGYFIRACGGEDVLFARTADGLDRAVRRYAKLVEAGEPIADETYHEGYRVGELRFAGVPVGEYAIAVEGEDEYIRSWATENCAAPFASLIKIACGAELSVGGEAEHKIVFRQIADESFKESSYHYFFEGGDLIFEYADLGGARNAFVKFLEAECGWDDLYYGCDLLKEADVIDVSADTDVLCHPRFDGIRMTTLGSFYPYNTLYSVSHTAFTYKYRVESAHHWLGAPGRWAADYGIWGIHRKYTMVCLTDEEVFDVVVEQITEYIKSRLDAGEVIGDSFTAINLGMEDGNYWCDCKKCSKIKLEEGGTWSGPMVRFANAVEEAIDEAGYDGLKFPIFAYLGSNKPPVKTAPNDDVYVTFVCDSHCNKHDLSNEQCYTIKASNKDLVSSDTCLYAEMIKGWLALTPNVVARPAPLGHDYGGYGAFTLIDQTYGDVTFLSDCGVRWVYDEIGTVDESDPMLIISELWDALMFDPDMTRAEYYEEVARLFEKYYGTNWRHVLRYYDLLEEAEIAGNYCWTNWYSSDYFRVDLNVYRDNWDEMLSELALAERGADSAHQEDLIRRIRADALYSGCTLLYFKAYQLEDDETLDLLRGRWAEMNAVLATCGYEKLKTGGHLLETLDDTMWQKEYADQRKVLVYYVMGIGSMRPAPEGYDN